MKNITETKMAFENEMIDVKTRLLVLLNMMINIDVRLEEVEASVADLKVHITELVVLQ